MWVAVGGSPQSIVRAGTLGLSLVLAIIGGQPERFVPLVDLYREAARTAGHDPEQTKVAINTHAFVGATSGEADAAFAAPYLAMMNRIGRERGWPPLTHEQYEASASLRGANFVGTPEQVVEKILFQHEIFGHQRFLVQFSVGPMPHDKVMQSIELLGNEVAPAVRKKLRTEAVAQTTPRSGITGP